MIVTLGGGEALRIRTPDGKLWDIWPAEVSSNYDAYGLTIMREEWPQVALEVDNHDTGRVFVKEKIK